MTGTEPAAYVAPETIAEPPVVTVLLDRDGYAWQRCGTDADTGVNLPGRTGRGRTSGWIGSRSPRAWSWSGLLIDHGPLTRMAPVPVPVAVPEPDPTAEESRLRHIIAEHRGTYSVRAAAERCLDADSTGADHERHLRTLRNALDQTASADAGDGHPGDDLDRLRTNVRLALVRAGGHDTHAPGVRAPVGHLVRELNALAELCIAIRGAATPDGASESPMLGTVPETVRGFRARIRELAAMERAAVQRASDVRHAGTAPDAVEIHGQRYVLGIDPANVRAVGDPDGVTLRAEGVGTDWYLFVPGDTTPEADISFRFARDRETYRPTGPDDTITHTITEESTDHDA